MGEMLMNTQLAIMVDGCTLARCLESHRFDTYPLVLNGACFAFADQFLKVAKDYGVSVLLNSSPEFNCCVKIQIDKFGGDQAVKIRKSLDTMVPKSALAETERQIFPAAYSCIKSSVEEKRAKHNAEDKREFSERYGGQDWNCAHRDALSIWMTGTKKDFTDDAIRGPCINLWMSSQNRLGLIAHVINREPGLAVFLSKNGKRMDLPLMVFELLSIVAPVIYRRLKDTADPTDFELGLAFQSRDYANGGFYSGLPFRPTASHPFAQKIESKAPVFTMAETQLKPLGGMAALFALFAHVAKLRHVDVSHFDGFLHSAMGYALGIVDAITGKGDPRRSVLPVLTGSEVKIGWKLIRKAHELPDEDVQSIVPVVLDSWRTGLDNTPRNVIEVTKRGFCRQFVDPLVEPSGPQRWRETRYAFMTMADAEKCLAGHAHYDAILKLREWAHNTRNAAEQCRNEHRTDMQTLAQEGKTTTATVLMKKGPKTPSRVLCIELKNVNAANCVPSIERVLLYGLEFFAVEYFSREDGHYNTLIITRASEWNAYQTYCAIEVFSNTNEDIGLQNLADGIDVRRMPQAAAVFQLITSGSAAQLRVGFWALCTWYGYKRHDYPVHFPQGNFPGGHGRVATCIKRFAREPFVVQALVGGLCIRDKQNDASNMLMCALEGQAGLSLPRLVQSIIDALEKERNVMQSSDVDNTRYDSMLMQRQFGRPRSKAHTFNTLFEPGCSGDNGAGWSLMVALMTAEAAFCGTNIPELKESEGTDICGNVSHVCTSLYDFPLAVQRGKGKTSVLYADTLVFIHRREYDEELDKSDTFRWFEMLYRSSLPEELFVGGNDRRKTQLQNAVKKRSAPSAAMRASPKKQKQKLLEVVPYDPEVPYSPTRD